MRARLPTRRPCERITITHGNMTLHVTVGRYWSRDGLSIEIGEIAETFIKGGKVGSAFADAVNASAVMASIALQHGATLEELYDALPKDDAGQPAEPLGAAFQAIMQEGRNETNQVD